MAGKRQGTGKPLVRTARVERRTANLDANLMRALTPQDKVAVAADHLRSALACHPDHEVTDRVVRMLVKEADYLYKQTGATR